VREILDLSVGDFISHQIGHAEIAADPVPQIRRLVCQVDRDDRLVGRFNGKTPQRRRAQPLTADFGASDTLQQWSSAGEADQQEMTES